MTYGVLSAPVEASRVKPRKPTRKSQSVAVSLSAGPKHKPRKPQRSARIEYPDKPLDVVPQPQPEHSRLEAAAEQLSSVQLKRQAAESKRDIVLLQRSIQKLEGEISATELKLEHEMSNSQAFQRHIDLLVSKSDALDELNNRARDVINDTLNQMNEQKSEIYALKLEISNCENELRNTLEQRARLEERQNLATASSCRDEHYIRRIAEIKEKKLVYEHQIEQLRLLNDELASQTAVEREKMRILNSTSLQVSGMLTERQNAVRYDRESRERLKSYEQEIVALGGQKQTLEREIDAYRAKYQRKIGVLQSSVQ